MNRTLRGVWTARKHIPVFNARMPSGRRLSWWAMCEDLAWIVTMVRPGLTTSTPPATLGLRGGIAAWFGWPTMPRMEALRAGWFETSDTAAQKAICAEMERQFWAEFATNIEVRESRKTRTTSQQRASALINSLPR